MSEAGTIIQKLGRNERPMCGDCAREMWLEQIKPAHLGLELRTYELSVEQRNILCEMAQTWQEIAEHAARLEKAETKNKKPNAA
jgi:hypothetical protein